MVGQICDTRHFALHISRTDLKQGRMMKASLIIVAKKPEPGFTKTRLCPPFTPEAAAEFYGCLMKDTLALAAQMPEVDLTLAYTPASAVEYFQNLVPNGFRLTPQQGTHLGERLANALALHLKQGYRWAVIMNSDGPTLPLAHLEEAFTELNHADVTLGMGHDGGYYLIGLKRMVPELFENIAWSTERVIPQTLEICRRLHLKVHSLPEWYDVDVEADLQRLRLDLLENPSAAQHTADFLKRWDQLQMKPSFLKPS
ncbi:MAG: TIGR04282 family arsenosugar biosynthesis glycosyltransferase [Desulfobacterales bacterium]|nr:TIGR04282 family arsenosugar biosynthesis glycosyltransferase [Desulfobacterales bacterium]